MLVEFSVNNFKSIKDTITFSMVSGRDNTFDNTVKSGKLNLLPSAIIYGANASGKSNILEAFNMMRRIVLNQDKIIQSTDELPYMPFRLSSETEDASTSFDVVFAIDNKKYKYGFEYDRNTVYAEYLKVYDTTKPTNIFEFDIDTGYKPNAKINQIKNLRKLDNSLYIWKADQEGYEIAKIVLEWFKNCIYVSCEKLRNNSYFQSYLMNKEDRKASLVNIMQEADLGIKDLEKIIMNDPMQNGIGMETSIIKTLHQKYDQNNKPLEMIKFDLDKDESLGTRKFFYMLEPTLLALYNGSVLLMDELDANLHPILVRNFINIFNDIGTNTNHAQIIFSSQDTNHLDLSIFHKSQIWFTEKDDFSATHLTSLAAYKNVMKNDNLEKDYIMGKYGAIPYIGDFNELLGDL